MKVEIPYLSRIEGHAHLVVDAAAGEVTECRLEVVETPRFFEKLLVGRHYTEVAGLAARICGVCSHSHTIVSLMATEQAFGLTVSEQTQGLRRLLMYGEIIQSHLLHLYFMALPDYLGVSGLLSLAQQRRDLVARALRLKKMGNDLCNTIGGRPVHPVTTCVGGFFSLPTAGELQAVRRQLAEALPDLEETVELFAEIDWPDYARDTEYLTLVDSTGYPLLGDMLLSSEGPQVAAGRYRELIHEYVVPHSTAKYARAATDSYMVGPLARFRQGYAMLSPLARKVAEALGLDAETTNPYLAQGARLVEVVHCVEQAMRLIDHLLLDGLSPANAEVVPREGQGTAALEAPRGLLLHSYNYDRDGLLTAADCVIPTAQNLANLETDLRTRAPQILDRPHEAFQADLERLVRAYDPCLSCSTHLLTIKKI